MAKKSKKSCSRSSKKRAPYPEHIAKGLYIDFEGFAPYQNKIVRPPSLCGYRFGVEDPVIQVVFSDNLKWAAIESGLKMHSWKQFLIELMSIRDERKCHIIAFSEHEQKVINEATGFKYQRSYDNVRTIAKHSLKDRLPENCDNSLIEYLDIVGISIPEDYGKQQVTKWLRNVMKYSSTKKGWGNAPKIIKHQWECILSHNVFDIKSLPLLLASITK